MLCWCNTLCPWEPDSQREIDGALHVCGCEQSARHHAYITALQTKGLITDSPPLNHLHPLWMKNSRHFFLFHSCVIFPLAFIFPLPMPSNPLSLSSLVFPDAWVGSVTIPLCLLADKASQWAFRCYWLCLVSLCTVFWKSQNLPHSILRGWINDF